MTNPIDPTSTATTCPLARDGDGNAVELPPGAAAWRVRRKTGGRPRIVLGVDKQPMQLPLGYTIVDLEDVLAPAEYLLDIVDAKGNALGMTIALAIGQLRNADGDDGDHDEPAAISTSLPMSGSEVRLVLEANVRATQMAFLHNQKTLELGLKMAETLRDGVRVMAESQADWIKSVSSARGFFRNAPVMPALPPPERSGDDEDDEEDPDDDRDDEPTSQPHWIDALMPHVVQLVQVAVPTLTAFMMKSGQNKKAGSKFELGDILNWNRVAQKRKAALEAARSEPAEPAAIATKPFSPVAFFMSLPEETRQKVFAVQAMLSPDEQKQLMQVLPAFDADGLQTLIAQVDASSPEQLAKLLRSMLATKAA